MTAIIAAIDYLTAEEPILRVRSGFDLPLEFRARGPECQHCGQNRLRKTVYVLVTDAGEYRQVGSTCLGDYVGGGADELVHSFNAQLAADEEERIRQSRMLRLVDYLTDVAATIRECGWTSARKARETGNTPTATRALWAAQDGIVSTEADLQTAKSAIAWAQSLNEKEANDYLHNLHVLAGQQSIEPQHMNLAASMLVAHQSAIERANRRTASAHFGEVGKRSVFILTVDRVFPIESVYGVTHVHTMHDSGGNVAVWFSTATVLEVGKQYRLTATVKSHGVRDGVAQTVLTRCKVAP